MDLDTFPTKSNLIAVKNTLEMAKLGFDLMDRKRNVLIMEIMELNKRAKNIQSRLDETFSEAYAALQKANIETGISNVWNTALNVPLDNGVKIRERSVMGVLIPLVTWESSGAAEGMPPPFAMTGTSSALDSAFSKFKNVKALIIELAMVENTAYRLAFAIKKTQKRANALKNVMIPKYESLVKTISDTLDERERDNFTRLKVIKRKI